MRSPHALRARCRTRLAIAPHERVLPRADRAARAGRALVDVLVALVVLGLCGAATVDAVRAAIVASDRITFVQAAHALSRDVAETVQAAPCDLASGTVVRGRTTLTWMGTRAGPLASAALEATAAPHPATPFAPRALAARASGWCR